ncbi:MAG: cell division ATP-binding protein FtsE [Clostridiales bacterium]|nr:cell division ATP-binding protein FtsE [Clostridiales bacterium]HQA48135.1 cell division ATP-binding protein FtsE [Bacillota bacterium]HQD42035.1 cell division ATP-binding protein FtsE [Bacillota bacterium]
MISINNVSKIYPNGTVALNGINIEIHKGEFVFFVGSSGAGKSTLVKMLLKEENPTSGSISVDGVVINSLKRRQIPYYRRKLGVVFQDFRLLPDKTVAENIAFAMHVVEASRREIARQVPRVLSVVGLGDKANVFPGQLSGGEQQRVSLARAIVNNPSLLIADEPTGNLDPDTAWEIMKLLKEINQRGTTIIMATHARDIVNYMRQRVVTLERGRIVRDQERGGYGIED